MAGGTDVQRLLLQVDASVELAKRNMRDLRNAVDSDTTAIDNALGKVEKSHVRMGQQLAKTGQFRGGMQQLSFQVGDVSQQLALGTKASVIFAQQSGQVIQAIQLMNSGTSGFLKFMAGPWGVVLTTAGVILATFAGRLFQTKDGVAQLVDKMREQAVQARLNEQANKIWEHSLDGVIDKTKKLREEQQQQLQTDRERSAQQLKDVRDDNANALKAAAAAKRALPAARQRLGEAQSTYSATLASSGGQENAGAILLAGNQLAAARAEVQRLTDELNKAQAAAASTGVAIRNIEVLAAREDAHALSDPATAIKRRYDALRRTAENTIKDIDKLTQRLAKLDSQEKAALDAVSGGANDRQSGRQIDFAQAAAIATGAGLKVNSAQRSTADQARLYNDPKVNRPGNPVAAPGTSAHEGAKGKWAIDIQITDGVTPASIRKLYADQGVSLSKVLKEKGHFHIEGSRSEAAAAENAAAKATNKRQDQDDAFAGQLQTLQQQLLAAQMELVTGVDAQANFAKQQVDEDQKRFALAVQNDVNDERLRDEQGKLLIAKSEAVALQRKANIDAQAAIQKLEEQQRTLDQESEFRLEALRYSDEIAKSQAEHRRIQLQIIDALYAQREADLKIAKAKAEAAQNWEEAARVQASIDQLPTQRGRDQARARKDTQSPLEKWADGIPQTADEMNQAMQELEVQGINGVVDSLVALTDGWDSMKEVALSAIKQIIAELIRMQLMKLALNLIGGSIGGAGGAGAGSGINIGGGTSNYFASNPFGGALTSHARGGMFEIGGRGGIDNNILSINGRAVARVSRGETAVIVPQASSASIPRPANGNSPRTGGGDTILNAHMHFHQPVRNPRKTGLQAASGMRTEIARAAKRGS